MCSVDHIKQSPLKWNKLLGQRAQETWEINFTESWNWERHMKTPLQGFRSRKQQLKERTLTPGCFEISPTCSAAYRSCSSLCCPFGTSSANQTNLPTFNQSHSSPQDSGKWSHILSENVTLIIFSMAVNATLATFLTPHDPSLHCSHFSQHSYLPHSKKMVHWAMPTSSNDVSSYLFQTLLPIK